MKKLSLLAALLCASAMMFAAPENYALKSNGSSAAASSGTAEAAIDGNEGTRWESASTDDETWTLDMGQSRTFNTVKILWEDAYCTEFTISYSADGETWTIFHDEKALAAAGWQTIYKESSVTGRYVQYHGTKRATGYGQSFYEFQVFQGDAPKVYTQIPVTLVAQSEGENSAERALDGNDGTEWQGRPAGITGGDDEARTFDAWFVVDLGGFYEIEMISIKFEGACSQLYHIDFSLNNSNWVLGYDYVGNAGINGHTDELTSEVLDNYQKVRYIRFWSTKAATEWGMKIYEFKVFGKEYVDSDDTEKPVMTSAQLVSKTWSSVVIAVAATDNNEVAKFHVVDAAKSIDVKLAATDGKITVTGLTAATAYNFTITAIDAAQNESANSKAVAVTTDAHLIAPTQAAAAPTWPDAQVKAIYSPTYNADCNFQDWGSGTVYAQEQYGKKYTVTNGGYFGVDGFSINAMTMEALHYDIWIDVDATLRIVPICRNSTDTGNEPEYGEFVNLKGQQWNSIDLALNEGEFAKTTNWSNVYQVKIDNAANLTFWVGNAYFYRSEPLEDNEAPENVQGSMASAGYFNVTLAVSATDNMGVVNFTVKNGETVVANGAGASGATVNILVPNLQANTEYNFTVIATDDKDNAADAIYVSAKTLVAPDPADAPMYSEDKVLGVFTDIYNDLNVGIQGWYAEPVISIGALSANSQAICLTPNTTPSSCFGLAFSATDITAYNTLEMDVYPTVENAVLDIQVIGVGDASTTFNLAANKWNHISLNIAGNEKTNCEQIGFYNCNNLLDVCFIQNVLFVQNGGTAVDAINAAAPATKFIENGSLFILRDGVVYTIQGAVVR